MARLWLQKTSAARARSTQDNVTGWLERDIFPFIGQAAISTLTPKDILLCQQRMEARGVMESPHRVKQICGQVFRFAVASDLVEPAFHLRICGTSLLDRRSQAIGTTLCTAQRATVRRVGTSRPRSRRVVDTWREDEDEDGSSCAVVPASSDNPSRSKTDDRPWEICPSRYSNRRALHEREHVQRGVAQHGVSERCHDCTRISSDGSQYGSDDAL